MPVPSQQASPIETLMDPVSAKERGIAQPVNSLVQRPPSAIVEETIENVNKDKLNNMKMIMGTYVQGALRDKEKGDMFRYNQLVAMLLTESDNEDAPSPVKLYVWVVMLNQSVSKLDKTCATLVDAALRLDWAVRDTTFAEAYVEFIKNLVSAHAFYVVPVLDSLVSHFLYREVLPNYARVSRSKIYERVHAAIRAVIALMPTGIHTLNTSIIHHIPHTHQSSAVQAAYTRNMLEVLNYAPYLRRQIFDICVQQMVKIDSFIQIELDELEDEVDFSGYDMNFDEDYYSDISDSESEDDDDASVEDDGYDHEKEVTETKQTRIIQSMVRKLDAMMTLMLRHLSQCALNASQHDRNDIYSTLVFLFDEQIIKTLKSRYTQFLIFYFCSLDVNVYPENFVEHLFDEMNNSARPDIVRVACASYISSFVARAKVLEPNAIQRIMNFLCSWCYDYLSQVQDIHCRPDPTKHDIFYAVMQAIMYIFCFRWRDLVVDDADLIAEDTDDAAAPSAVATSNTAASDGLDEVPMIVVGNGSRKWCRGLRDINVLLQSKLNPLKICSELVVSQFAKIAGETDLVYVHAMIENNKRVYVTGVSAGMTDGSMRAKNNLATIQSFFPFDPYNLKNSKSFIENIYYEWVDNDDDSDEDEDDEEDDEDDETDDEGAEMMVGLSAMSLSPHLSTDSSSKSDVPSAAVQYFLLIPPHRIFLFMSIFLPCIHYFSKSNCISIYSEIASA
ncbi:RNA polymerase I-specific transcription initiation factor RRN3-domain-containing protein [Dichotomocladium elegans]|nr:RNA polymerase I-specific transcription initiation factor RRN3-domain-containing protein [Dichotomocladium elegans]